MKESRNKITSLSFFMMIWTMLYVAIVYKLHEVWTQAVAGAVYFIVAFILIRIQDKEVIKLEGKAQWKNTMESTKQVPSQSSLPR